MKNVIISDELRAGYPIENHMVIDRGEEVYICEDCEGTGQRYCGWLGFLEYIREKYMAIIHYEGRFCDMWREYRTYTVHSTRICECQDRITVL